MRIDSNKILESNGTGYVTLTTEEEDDVWDVYNLISIGDIIKSKTVRKIKNVSSSDMVTVTKKTLVLSIKVTKLDYDGEGNSLRVSGVNTEANDYVSLGSFHTLDIQLHTTFTLTKEFWDSIYIDQLCQISRKRDSGNVFAVVFQEGLANICVIRNGMCIVKSQIEKVIPGKGRGGSAQNEKALQSFYSMIYNSLFNYVDFATAKVILLCSSGYLNQNLLEFMCTSSKTEGNTLHSHKAKFLCIHSNSGHVHALREVLQNEKVIKAIEDTQFAEEIAVLEQFSETFRTNPDRVSYGEKSIQYCISLGAVDTLLISDLLVRGKTAETRKRIISLMDDVKLGGGKVYLFSSRHPSGKHLNNLTGIAAILRFPVDEAIESEDSFASSSDSDDDM